jgi:ketosteroid isomerase-like protein
MLPTRMTTPTDLMHVYLAAARRGDLEAALALVADDATFRIPGRSPLAGIRFGRQAALDYIRSVVAAFDEVELMSVSALSNDEQFVLIVSERIRRNGEDHLIPRANAYLVEDGQITEITIYEGDQYLVDELLAERLVGDRERFA